MKLRSIMQVRTATTYISSYRTWYCGKAVDTQQQIYQVESDVGLLRVRESALKSFPLSPSSVARIRMTSQQPYRKLVHENHHHSVHYGIIILPRPSTKTKQSPINTLRVDILGLAE